ncbi:MAG: DUF1206 domain-containing protein [Jatrophihabitantaceae bacterium]
MKGAKRAVARRIKRGRFGQGIARFGLASRAIVYLPLAVLMVDLAIAGNRRETDQGGALRDLGTTRIGTVFLIVFAIGAVCYCAWRWAEAALGRHLEKLSATDRVKAFVEGACYLPFGIMAVSVASGDSARARQAGTYRSVSGQVMQSTAGRVLVGAVGLVIVVVGAYLFSEGPRRSFAGNLDLDGASPLSRRVTLATGVVGATTRGTVFALAGVLVVVAAVTASPSKAGGIDTALRTVAHAPFGRVVLVAAAIGIAAFGMFALAEARWREVT